MVVAPLALRNLSTSQPEAQAPGPLRGVNRYYPSLVFIRHLTIESSRTEVQSR